jgi:hypothetical protein
MTYCFFPTNKNEPAGGGCVRGLAFDDEIGGGNSRLLRLHVTGWMRRIVV